MKKPDKRVYDSAYVGIQKKDTSTAYTHPMHVYSIRNKQTNSVAKYVLLHETCVDKFKLTDNYFMERGEHCIVARAKCTQCGKVVDKVVGELEQAEITKRIKQFKQTKVLLGKL